MTKLNCFQKNLLSAPDCSQYLCKTLQKTATGNYCSSKCYGMYAVILATFSAPLYVLKGIGEFVSNVAELKIGKGIVALGTNTWDALKCIFIAAALIVCIVASIFIPCALNGFRQEPAPRKPSYEDIEGLLKHKKMDYEVLEGRCETAQDTIKTQRKDFQEQLSNTTQALETEKKLHREELAKQERQFKEKESQMAKEAYNFLEKNKALTEASENTRRKLLARISKNMTTIDELERRVAELSGEGIVKSEAASSSSSSTSSSKPHISAQRAPKTPNRSRIVRSHSLSVIGTPNFLRTAQDFLADTEDDRKSRVATSGIDPALVMPSMAAPTTTTAAEPTSAPTVPTTRKPIPTATPPLPPM